MRFLAVLTLSLVTLSCSAETVTNAIERQAQQDPGISVAIAPLPTATPTVAARTETATVTSKPNEDSAPTFDRLKNVDLDGNGTITEDERVIGDDHPAVYARPVADRVGDLVAVDYASTPGRTITLVQDTPLSPIITDQTTPDGRSIWVRLPGVDTANDNSCSEHPHTRLGVQPIEPPGRATPVEPHASLPANISQIHHGPNDRVLFYTTCNGETRPAAFATTTADGNFVDVQLVDPLLAQTIAASRPEWRWGKTLPVADYFGPSDLVVMVPQHGLVATDVRPKTPSHVYIDATTGVVLDVWASNVTAQRPVGFGQLKLNGGRLEIGSEIVPLPYLAPTVLVVRSAAGPGQPPRVLAGGDNGSSIVLPDGEAPFDVINLGPQPVTSAAWAPVGPWVALTGPGGTWLHNSQASNDGEIISLSELEGQAVYFSPNGSKLVIAATGSHEIIEFAEIPEPDDTTQVTAFSTLDSGGLGPLRIEMLVSEARELTGIDFELSAIDDVEVGYCVWIHAPGLPGVTMLGEAVSDTDAAITSIAIYAGPWATPSGIRIGATEDDVYRAFPDQIDSEPHRYAAGNYLYFVPEDPNDGYSIKFETEATEVIALHAGRRDWISYIEGCA